MHGHTATEGQTLDQNPGSMPPASPGQPLGCTTFLFSQGSHEGGQPSQQIHGPCVLTLSAIQHGSPREYTGKAASFPHLTWILTPAVRDVLRTSMEGCTKAPGSLEKGEISPAITFQGSPEKHLVLSFLCSFTQ